MVDFTIGFDNGGGATLETANYCHYYSCGKQLAGDVLELLESGSTLGWDNNETEMRGGGEFDLELDKADVEAAIKSGSYEPTGGYTADLFFAALGLAEKE